MKRNLIYIALLVIVAACSGTDKKAQLEKLIAQRDALNTQIEQLESELNINPDSAKTKLIDVRVTEVVPQTFKHYIEIQGKVDGEDNISVSSQAPGQVTAIHVKEGDAVRKGQVLVDLDVKVLRQSLEQVKTQYEFAKTVFEKQKYLWEKKIGSEIQYLQAKNNKEALEQNIATLKDQIEMSRIVAPISGTIEELPMKVGQMISPGTPGSAIRIVNMSRAKIVADLGESYAAKVRVGNETHISFPDFNEEIVTKLSFSSKYIDPTNRTFKAECWIDNNKYELRANMIATMKINDYTSDSALVVPVNIIQKSLEGDFIWIAKTVNSEAVAERRNIRQGRAYNGLVEITSGLTPGDRVVSTGYQGLKDGDRLKY
ncbi:MAG: efflux RND transporter periplasmic adaptor subunit [Bacteroidales bacterium]|nr:efflux RND transporter periplasmic adaptor subunit [Bacteroidales bacterium]MDD3666728.1 efflux RND transporter periplasmic adaptor subunit [Bacteroidales bacterium]